MAVKKTVQSQRHKLQIYFLKVKKKNFILKIRIKFVPFNNSLNKETISTFLVLKAEFRCGIIMGGEILRFSG